MIANGTETVLEAETSHEVSEVSCGELRTLVGDEVARGAKALTHGFEQ